MTAVQFFTASGVLAWVWLAWKLQSAIRQTWKRMLWALRGSKRPTYSRARFNR